MHLLIFIALTLIWGSSFILMKQARLALGAFSVGGGRVFLASLVLGIIWILTRRGKLISPAQWGWLALIAIAGEAIPFALQPYLIGATGNSGFFGMMVCFVPLLTILLSIPLLHHHPTRRELLGVLGGLACMPLIVNDGFDKSITGPQILLALVVPLSYALSNTLIRRQFSQASPLVIAFGSMLISTLVLGPLAITTETIVPNEHLTRALLSLAVLGVVATGLAIYAFYFLVQTRGPLYASMVTYVVPCFALFWGWLDGESVSWVQMVALAVVLSMVYVVQSRPIRPLEERTHERTPEAG